jgi:GTP-binding protein EngB required for normal cell division
MPEPTSRELYEIINEMRVEIGVINTKMDFVMDSKKTAERAEGKADKALLKTDELANDIDGIKKTAMWAIGLAVTAGLSCVGLLVTIVIAVFK